MFLTAGNANEGYTYGQHHPKVKFDDSVLFEGSAAYAIWPCAGCRSTSDRIKTKASSGNSQRRSFYVTGRRPSNGKAFAL